MVSICLSRQAPPFLRVMQWSFLWLISYLPKRKSYSTLIHSLAYLFWYLFLAATFPYFQYSVFRFGSRNNDNGHCLLTIFSQLKPIGTLCSRGKFTPVSNSAGLAGKKSYWAQSLGCLVGENVRMAQAAVWGGFAAAAVLAPSCSLAALHKSLLFSSHVTRLSTHHTRTPTTAHNIGNQTTTAQQQLSWQY